MKRIFAAAVLLFVATFALADGRSRGAADPRYRDLNLTDGQKAQIAQLQTQFREASRDAFAEAREATKEYREARRAGDTAKMAELRPQVVAKRAELKKLRQAQNEQIRALLTPEQQKKWDERRRGNRRN